MQPFFIPHLQLRRFQILHRQRGVIGLSGIAADNRRHTVLFIRLPLVLIVIYLSNLLYVRIPERNHRSIAEGGIARTGIEDRHHGSGFPLIDDDVISAGGNGFVYSAVREHETVKPGGVSRNIGFRAAGSVVDEIIILSLRIAGIARCRIKLCTEIALTDILFLQAFQLTGGLCEAQMVLGGNEDFLRGAVQLHEPEVLLVLYDGNEADARQDDEDGDHHQHLRQGEALRISFSSDHISHSCSVRGHRSRDTSLLFFM